MTEKKDYLDEAVRKHYDTYSNKGLQLRVQPFLQTELPKNPARLLVVGIALGGEEEIEAMNTYFPSYEVYGVDVARSALHIKSKAKLIYSDICSLNFENNFFSGVMCSAVLHEVYSFKKDGKKEVKRAIKEIYRALAIGGIAAIREFFVPSEEEARLFCITEESFQFSKQFIEIFRKNLEKDLRKNFILEGREVFSSKRLLTDLMLHFRVAKIHFKSFEDFFRSKEAEEIYLPLSEEDYIKNIESAGGKVVNTSYIDFPNYYETIEKNFKLMDNKGNKIKNKFGFVDIVFKKK